MKPKIAIFVEGGCVTSVQCDTKDGVECVLIDYDNESTEESDEGQEDEPLFGDGTKPSELRYDIAY